MLNSLAFLGLPQGAEWIILLVIALLLFGKRLPEVGKSLGRGIIEFKKGLKGVRDEMDEVGREVEDTSAQVAAEPKKDPAKLQAYHTDTKEQRLEEQHDQSPPPLASEQKDNAGVS